MLIQPNLRIQETARISRRCSAFAIRNHNLDQLIQQISSLVASAEYRSGHLHWLPKTRNDRSPSGIAWFLQHSASEDSVVAPLGAIPLRPAVGSVIDQPCLWIPTSASFSPEIPHQILHRDRLEQDRLLIWLPDLGPVGLECADQVDIHELFSPPCDESSPWMLPPDVWVPANQITEITRLNPPTASDVLKDMQREIGDAAQSLFNTEPDGSPKSNPNLADKFKSWLLGKADASTNKKDDDPPTDDLVSGNRNPKGPSVGSWGDAIGKGLAKAMSLVSAPVSMAMAKMLRAEREKQIEKLIGMLQSNPDQALKYALPISDHGSAPRGYAPPGSQLSARLPNFSLGGLKNSGPTDNWDIGDNWRSKLTQQYRDQANRELAAGRHRRAAYIFAHLLGDFRSAANALERGKHFAEAAVLYRDRLKDRSDAARCFASAGLHVEASDLYERLNELEKAGQVWLDAGSRDKAMSYFERAYQQAIQRGNMVSAARILDHRLESRPAAIKLLKDQWPHGNDAAAAAELLIAWLGDDSEHQACAELLPDLLESATPQLMGTLVDIFSRTNKQYPDQLVREAAEDLCRLAAARALNDGAPMERYHVLQTLKTIAQGDRQLRRDVAAYRSLLENSAKRTDPKPARRASELAPIKLATLGKRIDLVFHQQSYIGLDFDAATLHLVRYPTKDLARSLLKSVAVADGQDILDRDDAFLVQPKNGAIIAFAPVEGSTTDNRYLQIKVKSDCVDAAIDELNITWLLRLSADGEPSLSNSQGLTFDLSAPYQSASHSHTELISSRCKIGLVGSCPTILLGHHLFLMRRTNFSLLSSSSGLANDLSPSPKHTVGRIAVAHDEGLDVVWLDNHDVVNACEDIGYRLVQWMPGGHVVAVSEDNALHTFSIRGKHTNRVNRTALKDTLRPIQLLMLEPNVVGIAYNQGLVRRFMIS